MQLYRSISENKTNRLLETQQMIKMVLLTRYNDKTIPYLNTKFTKLLIKFVQTSKWLVGLDWWLNILKVAA